MNRKLLLVLLALSLLPAILSARTWSSLDGKRTFEGKYQSYDPEKKTVTVIKGNGQAITFSTGKLSKDDQKWILEKYAEDNKPDLETLLGEQKIGKLLTGRLHKLKGKKFKKAGLDFAPEYYLLYFSASW